MPQNLRKPRSIAPGSEVWAVAPAGCPDPGRFKAGVDWLGSQGFNVQAAEDVLTRKQRYVAGSAERRSGELRQAYVGATGIFAARGGYGTMHLLAALDELFRDAPPKLLVGFSDVTALGWALWRHRVPWVHGPLLTTLAAEPEESQHHLLAVVGGRATGRAIRGTRSVVGGRVRGRLLGGSLSLLAALCGTPWQAELEGAILFLEDIAEQSYRLDRLLTQLELAGVLAGVAGIAVGQLTACEPPDQSYAAADVVAEILGRTGVPLVMGFPFGHQAPNYALPFGGLAELDADARTLTLLEEITAG